MRRRSLLAAAGGLLFMPYVSRAAVREETDLLLVMAADVSHSMQPADLRMQREGYAGALRHPDVHRAIASGPCGHVAISYMEWSGFEDQRMILPWTQICGAADAIRVADALLAAPQRVGNWTSISGAIAASRRLMAAAPFEADRRVVDISGDGENNNGEPVHRIRDQAVEEGIIINGLPITRGPARPVLVGGTEMSPLEAHYREWVVGGIGAFVVPAQGFESFAGAIRRKLILEIAGLDAGPRYAVA